ncbi:MAG: polyprenol monophosphomannose synthase [Verrucomicrobiia bacterium]
MPKALIVIPTYNEAENLSALWEQVPQVCGDYVIDKLFVDDASQDGTREWIKSRPEFGASIFLLERDKKLGLGTAYLAGFAWALQKEYELIFEMDADLSHDPKMIPHFIEAIKEGGDVVLGSRYIRGVRVLNWPISRLLLSLGAAKYVKMITGMPFSDPTGGYKCFRRSVLETLDLSKVRSNGYAFQIELTYLAWKKGFHIAEIPIVFEERRAGQSKMSFAIAREAIWQVVRLRLQNLLGR